MILVTSLPKPLVTTSLWVRDIYQKLILKLLLIVAFEIADAYWTRSLPRDVMGIDLSTEFVYTSASSLPRSGMAKLTVNAFGYDFDAIEVNMIFG